MLAAAPVVLPIWSGGHPEWLRNAVDMATIVLGRGFWPGEAGTAVTIYLPRYVGPNGSRVWAFREDWE